MYLPVFRYAVIACILLQILGAAIDKKATEAKTPWKLEEALTATSEIKGFNGTWITDNEFYYTASDKTIYIYDAALQQSREFVSKEFLDTYTGGTFTLSPDNKMILIRYAVEAVFRHSYIAKYDIFYIETGKTKQIHNGAKLQYCTWSTVNDRLSYVYDNNVYIHFENDLEVKITTEGVNGEIYVGIPDWVYEEEVLSSGSAMWWSPDGTKLAVGSFNDTAVQTFTYYIYGESEDPEYQYPQGVDLKYPKPGTPNPVVSIKVYDLSPTAPSIEIIQAPIEIVSPDHILQNVAWSSKDELLITWLNRRQNIGSIQLCGYKGNCKEVKRLEEPKGWISISNPMCLSSGNNCLMRYWIGNWYQIWNLDLTTGENIWSSRGDFTVTGLYGYDEENDNVYYQATLPGDPSQSHIFRNDVCLTCSLIDEDGDTCRQASATFSKGFSYNSFTCSGPNPSYTGIFNTTSNSKLATWELNSAFRQTLSTKLRPTIKFINVTLGGGFTGYARFSLPPSLNWDNPDKDKKYPTIVYVYGGPNSVRTTSSFTVGFEGYLTTNREVIYVIIDGRGTGNKGKDLLFSVNNNLGDHEVEDQISVTKYLQEEYSFIDTDSTGMWGWSYGGYMTAKTLGKDSDKVFQCGVSVAPVTSWIYYDTIYTERYMGLPTLADNLGKYKYSSILEDVDNFKIHDFLLIHGSGDDNVHYQQSLMLAKVLQKKDILFNEMTYTDENHSIGSFLPHLYNTIDNFFLNCLNMEYNEANDENDVEND